MIIPFSAPQIPNLADVGGKGLSLIRMTRAGMPVPAGFILPTAFFDGWMTEMKAAPDWARLQSALYSGGDLLPSTDALKAASANLALTGDQELQLRDAVEALPKNILFAVRSSSPEEDLEGASFAGGYKTTLGVTEEALHDAIRASFASAFDERVFVYKQQQGFATDDPKIAVIVQQQIDSETAGVGFSLNPLNNDYDEGVIDANWGLGESVVSGSVSPDHFVVDKVNQTIIEKKLGGKEKAITLSMAGGIEEKDNPDSGKYCLTDEQVIAVSDMLIKIENLFNQPIDIEWAFTGENLYLLQARPITAYIPLPEEMLTTPGERRILYWDAGLSDGVTINRPMSPLTLDWLFASLGTFSTPIIGPIKVKAAGIPAKSLLFGAGGRFYINLSQVITVYSAKRLGKEFQSSEVDVLLSELLSNIDEDRYRAWEKIDTLSWGNLLLFIPKVIWHSRTLVGKTIAALWNPEKYFESYELTIKATIRDLNLQDGSDIPLKDFIYQLDEKLAKVMGEVALPGLVPYLYNFMRVDKNFGGGTEEHKRLVDSIKMGVAGNEAVDIGIRMYHMSKMLSPDDFSDLDLLVERLEKEELPVDFHAAWNEFIQLYGMRGPGELELSNARYGDDPKLGLEQMSYMVETTFDPEQMQQKRISERQQAYETLHKKFDGAKQAKLERTYKLMDLLGGTRDTPKYLWVLDNGAVRRRALLEGKKFFEKGQLDHVEDIFWLSLSEIEKANVLPYFDLRAIIASKKPFYQKLEKVISFPHLIDSRGRIGQVPVKEKGDPNVFVGLGISRGVSTGRIKVLHAPRDKPIEKGDVLVAYTTDPGWTPLFVNAEAVILEVGGMLQHGGVVAREYGKPCVAGIQGITTKLRDGQLVEVNGTTGVVRILDP